MRNLDELLDEAKWGKLANDEIAYVVEQIKATSPGNDDDLYTLIHILGRAGATQYKNMIEKFLHYPSNSLISAIALRTLCTYWGFEEEYLEPMKQFIQGVDWDTDRDLQMYAIGCAGQYLKDVKDKDLLKLILDVYQNENEDQFSRETAYEAIAFATGQTWEDLDQGPKPNPVVLDKAKSLLKD